MNKLVSNPQLEAGALLTKDGILLASEFSEELKPESFAAMSATLFASAEEVVSQYSDQTPKRVVVEENDKIFVLEEVSENIILIARSSVGVNEEVEDILKELRSDLIFD